MPEIDLLIIGAGPTGVQVAIDAKKAGLKHLLLDKGTLVNTLYNFPHNMQFFSTSRRLEIADTPFISHHPRPSKQEALEYYRRLLQHFQLNFHAYEKVHEVKKNNGHFIVHSDKGNYKAKNVVISTGFYDHPRMMNVPGENLPHVSHYYRDPHLYTGRKLLIIGAANSAVDTALDTWQKGAEIHVLVRGNTVSERVKYWIRPNFLNRVEEGSIAVSYSSNVKEITERKVIFEQEGTEKSVTCDHVLALTGYEPNFEFLKKCGVQISDGEEKIPLHNEETLESNISGLYLAGVLLSGRHTHRLLIENTRDHGKRIIRDILEKNS